jgi:ribosomal protein L17
MNMNNASYIASSTAANMVYAALAFATVASFATAMNASEQAAVTQAKASAMQVRVAEPMVVVAKRDVRHLDRMEIVGHRTDAAVASVGGMRTGKFAASVAR